MSYFINVLTLYGPTPEIQAETEAILTSNKAVFQRIDNTFFVGTPFKTTGRKIVDGLTVSGHKFTFCHVAIKNGSEIHGNIAPEMLSEIKRIFFSK